MPSSQQHSDDLSHSDAKTLTTTTRPPLNGNSGLPSSATIIIPTQNRSNVLQCALESLLKACATHFNTLECLVIDNGSIDDTKKVVQSFQKEAPFPVRYIFEPCPGLHVGRNLGAQLAQGSIVIYLDDDVLVQEGWLEAILGRFDSDSRIALLGGPCLPLWEAPPPAWIEDLKTPLLDGWYISPLSLLDLGQYPHPIPGSFVFGCNFAVRKDVLLRIGGFHPDGMPNHLLQYRGDGETFVGQWIDAEPNMFSFYEPKACVLHRVPKGRLTEEYISSIAQRNAISTAYATVRSLKQATKGKILRQALKCVKSLIKLRSAESIHRIRSPKKKKSFTADCEILQKTCYHKHALRLLFSPTLRAWAQQNTYFKEDPCPYFTPEEERA